MRRVTLSVVVVLLAAACGSSQPVSTSGGRAAIGVNLQSPPFFGSGTTAPANVDVVVENRSASPIVVRNVRLESIGMAQWGVQTINRMFNETIAPGDTKAFPLFATARALVSRMTYTEPLTVRSIVQFESEGKRFQEIYTGQANQN